MHSKMNGNSAVVEYGFPASCWNKSDFKVLKQMRKAFEHKKIYDFKDLLEKNKSRKSLPFIQEEGQLSLFETILQSKDDGSSQFISLMWVVCELSEDDTVLKQQNSFGKLPVEYVMESNSSENFFCFLIFDIVVQCVKRTPACNKYHLKVKNDQLIEREAFSIFFKILQIANVNNLKKCLIVLEELLMEMKEIVDIKNETDVDHLLNNLKDEKIKESILKLILKYWTVGSADYGQYRQTFEDISPYFHLYFSLKENNEQEFQKSFPDYLEFMESKQHKYLIIDCNHLLFAATQGNHEKAIKLIVGCYTNDKDLSEDYIQFMIKMIDNGFYLGQGINEESKDEDWIESDVLEQFLNSCVSNTTDKSGDKILKIDYTCFVTPEIRYENVEDLNDEPGLLLFNKSLSPVSMILDNDKLKHLITHPTIALFATLKCKKFQKIHNFNLYAFLILFVVPFMLLFMSLDSSAEGCRGESRGLGFISDAIYEISIGINQETWAYIFVFISLIFVTMRELVQFFISDSKLRHIKKKSNLLELALIISGWCVIFISDHYRVPSAFVILIASVEILMLLPTSTLSTYMFMLKTVSATFMKFFWIFLVIILAFTFSFYSLFRPVVTVHTELDNNNDMNITGKTMERCEGDENKNFEEIVSSFIKTTLMFAGNISTEPHTLETIWEKIFFFVFLITALVLINLINGLAISDIQELKDNSLFHDVKQRIRVGEGSENFMCNFYWKARLGPYTPDELLMYHIEGNNRNCWKRLLMRFAISIVKRFPYLHKMENLVIDYKFHNVAYCSYTKEMHPILTATNGKLRKFVILNEDFEKLNEIIKNREARNDAIDEEELVKLRTDRNQQEIINLNVKLERVQKDADILLSFIKNGFIEVNANISKLTPKSE